MLTYFYRLQLIISFAIIRISTKDLEPNVPSISYMQADQIDHARNSILLFENRFFEFNCSSSNADKIIISKDKKVGKIIYALKLKMIKFFI